MKFLLTSSGINNDCIAQALSGMLGKPLSEASILFVPTAANMEGEDKRWLIQNLKDLESHDFKSIDILDIAAVPKEIWKARFLEKDIVCVGGGNEKYLAEVFDNVGMKEVLLSLPDTKVYVGVSAGSMVTGQFMSEKLYPTIFPEEDFGVGSRPPMGIHSFCFIPHLNSDFFQHIRKGNLEASQDAFVCATYATDDETALKVENGEVSVVGVGESWTYVPGKSLS